jgi:hypothetical protein
VVLASQQAEAPETGATPRTGPAPVLVNGDRAAASE